MDCPYGKMYDVIIRILIVGATVIVPNAAGTIFDNATTAELLVLHLWLFLCIYQPRCKANFSMQSV